MKTLVKAVERGVYQALQLALAGNSTRLPEPIAGGGFPQPLLEIVLVMCRRWAPSGVLPDQKQVLVPGAPVPGVLRRPPPQASQPPSSTSTETSFRMQGAVASVQPQAPRDLPVSPITYF